MRFLYHVIRKEKLDHLPLTGLIAGKRARNRQRQTYLQQVGTSPNSITHDAYDKKASEKVIQEAINIWNRQDA